MKKIISSLFIYKSELFISYIDGKIKKQFINSPYNFSDRKKQDEQSQEIIEELGKKIIIDIKAYKNNFYILTRDGLYKYAENDLTHIKNIKNPQVMVIDSKLRFLFILSDDRGLISLDLNTDSYLDDIPLALFQNNDSEEENVVPITSIVANDGVLFASILNYGILRIDYKEKKSGKLAFDYLHKIKLENHQDISYDYDLQELAIVDFDEGLIRINLITGDTEKYILPNNDVPNTIKIVRSFYSIYYIIQARKGLYKFRLDNKTFQIMQEGRVSNLVSYYSTIYFTQNGEVKSLSV